MAIQFLTGQRLTADLLNTNVVDPTNASLDAKPIGKAYATATQALADATFVAINLAGEEYDTHGYHDTATNNTRVTPQQAGYYRFSGTVYFAGQTTPVAIDCYIRKNNATTLYNGVRAMGAATAIGCQVTTVIPMNGTTDYVELIGRQDSAGANTTAVNLPFTSILEWEYVRPL